MFGLVLGLLSIRCFALQASLVWNVGYRQVVSHLMAKKERNAEELHLAWLNESLRLEPANHRRRIALAYLLVQLGQFDQAITLVEEYPLPWTETPDIYSSSRQYRYSVMAGTNSRRFWYGMAFANHLAAEHYVLTALAKIRRAEWQSALVDLRNASAQWNGAWPPQFLKLYYRTLAHSPTMAVASTAQHILQAYQADPTLSYTALTQAPLMQPGPPMEFQRHPCKNLIAINYDQTALEAGPLVPVTLTWLANNPNDQNRTGTFQEHVLVANLASNAGFEWEAPCEGCSPLGWEFGVFVEDVVENRGVVISTRPGPATQVLQLLPSRTSSKSTSAASVLPINPSLQYVLGAWVKTEGGRGFIGYAPWTGSFARQLPYQYVVSGLEQSEGGFHYAVITFPPEVRNAELWLHVQGLSGPVYFDDVLFFPLNKTPCVQ